MLYKPQQLIICAPVLKTNLFGLKAEAKCCTFIVVYLHTSNHSYGPQWPTGLAGLATNHRYKWPCCGPAPSMTLALEWDVKPEL